jgi:hypothetical protein
LLKIKKEKIQIQIQIQKYRKMGRGGALRKSEEKINGNLKGSHICSPAWVILRKKYFTFFSFEIFDYSSWKRGNFWF